jgi:hypothetical protein
VIIGGGRVGRAIGSALDRDGVSFAIVEQLPERERSGVRYVIGDAADRKVLEAAGLDEASAVLITTHDDDVNVYLTRYCRGPATRTSGSCRGRASTGTCRPSTGPGPTPCCRTPAPARRRSGTSSAATRPCSSPRASTCSAPRSRASSPAGRSPTRTCTGAPVQRGRRRPRRPDRGQPRCPRAPAERRRARARRDRRGRVEVRRRVRRASAVDPASPVGGGAT